MTFTYINSDSGFFHKWRTAFLNIISPIEVEYWY